MGRETICGVNVDAYVIRMEEFHGYRSPGMLIGGVMIENGTTLLGSTPYLNVVCETVVCLPDAVQLLTPCTFGNGFLQILDWGKFALTVYDRGRLDGVRVWLNPAGMASYPLISDWFQRTGVRREKPHFEDLAVEVLAAGPDLISSCRVRLPRSLKEKRPVPTGLCPNCNESYPLHHGSTCIACQDHAYYEIEGDHHELKTHG